MKNCLPSCCNAAVQHRRPWRWCPVLLVVLLQACVPDHPAAFAPDSYPSRLSDWHLMHVKDSHLVLNANQTPYDLTTALFSDYALKLRSVWIPPGTAATYRADEPFDFPIGTVISKTFYYQRHPADRSRMQIAGSMAGFSWTGGLDLTQALLIETRLLVRQPHGWDALPYVWDATQEDARLTPGGAIEQLSLDTGNEVVDFAYIVPNRNECAACHVMEQKSDQLQPLGPLARNMNRTFSHYPGGPAPQLQHWSDAGLLTGAPAEAITSLQQSTGIDEEARGYLDINCGHCHRPGGSADTSGLFLHATATSPLTLGICKPPVAAGRGTGGHRYSVVPGRPEESILMSRVQSRELDIQMPELGRTLVHEEGVELLRSWINHMEGSCGPD